MVAKLGSSMKIADGVTEDIVPRGRTGKSRTLNENGMLPPLPLDGFTHILYVPGTNAASTKNCIEN